MGKTITKGKTFTATETVTNVKLHALVDDATITKVTDADGDTKIDMEESSDEDIIRFDNGGTEQVTIQDGKIEPTTDNDIDLGASGKEFKDLHLDGTANIDSLVADTADINAGTVDATLGGTTPAAVTGTTLKADTSLELASGATVTAILDEDAMGTDSATALATQQSIKAYTDNNITPTDARVKAWINFDGTGTPAINDSFNVSGSITDNDTGDYTVTWDTDFADINYSLVGTAVSSAFVSGSTNHATALAVGAATIKVFNDSGAAVDKDLICLIAIGDQ